MRNGVDGPLVPAQAIILANKHTVHEGELYIYERTSNNCIITMDYGSCNLSVTCEKESNKFKERSASQFSDHHCFSHCFLSSLLVEDYDCRMETQGEGLF